MQTLTSAETQEPQTATVAVPGADLLMDDGREDTAEQEESGGAVPARRQPLLFDPEPSQRMVVVRRRRRRKRVSRTEQLLGPVRVALLAIICAALAVRMIGLHRLTGFLGRYRVALHPLKSHLQAPDLNIIVLVLVALGLIYTMPGVQSRINRLLDAGRKRG